MDYLLRVEILRPISAMGVLVTKGLLMVVTYQRMKLMGLIKWVLVVID
jgi:hypothetical protein